MSTARKSVRNAAESGSLWAPLMADCHFHYSTRFAVKCVGCETAILKQFVEMNRNGKDECWHPECYMISKVRTASLSQPSVLPFDKYSC
jgi:hypothetical protein